MVPKQAHYGLPQEQFQRQLLYQLRLVPQQQQLIQELQQKNLILKQKMESLMNE